MTVNQQIVTSWLLIVFAFHYGAYGAMSIDNAVVGTPDIQCQARQLKVSISTKRPFEGRVFLKGQSHRPECVMDFSRFSESKTLNSTVEVAISYDSCATERIRSVSLLSSNTKFNIWIFGLIWSSFAYLSICVILGGEIDFRSIIEPKAANYRQFPP